MQQTKHAEGRSSCHLLAFDTIAVDFLLLCIIIKNRSLLKLKGDPMMLQTGIKGNQELTVTKDKCAGALGSGELDVYATPAMIALIEETAWKSVVPYLQPGEGTVGTALDVRHVAATPIGLQVRCETELTLVDRRRLVFRVQVFDPFGLVGEGTHERFVIQYEKFMKKVDEKRNGIVSAT